MAQFQFALSVLFFALLACLFQVEAAPLDSRQLGALGGIGCNVARLQTVKNLAATKKALGQVAAGDAATDAAVATAKTGLDNASAGIKTIAQGLLGGNNAGQDAARTQVGDGLTSAKTALGPLAAANPSIATTMASLDKTIAAGEQVVAKC